jgi:hypothetical protein
MFFSSSKKIAQTPTKAPEIEYKVDIVVPVLADSIFDIALERAYRATARESFELQLLEWMYPGRLIATASLKKFYEDMDVIYDGICKDHAVARYEEYVIMQDKGHAQLRERFPFLRAKQLSYQRGTKDPRREFTLEVPRMFDCSDIVAKLLKEQFPED